MATNSTFTAENTEISKRLSFNIQRTGAEHWDVALPWELLSDCISTLSSADGAAVPSLTRGTNFQVRKIEGNYRPQALLQWLGTTDNVYLLSIYTDEIGDLVDVLTDLSAETDDPLDLDMSDSAPIVASDFELPTDLITSTTVTRLIISEDPDEPLEDGDFLIVIPSGTLVPDTTSPTAPTGLNAEATGTTTVGLTWFAATDDVAVTGYEYRINSGAAVDVGLVLSTTVPGLTASTLYSFNVRAYDAAGNRSAWSTSDSATTNDPSGVTFTDDYAGMTAEVAPTGWTSQWAAPTSHLVKDEGTVSATKFARLVAQGSSSRAAVSFDGGGSNDDVELLCRWRAPVNNSGGGRLLARGAGTSGAETGILGYLSSTGQVTIGKYEAGAATTLDTGTGPGSPQVGNWYRMRLRVIGDTAELKIWADGVAEPASWQATATGITGVLGAGWVGHMGFNGATTDYDWISVAYDGATAPSVS
jgi:hypothetical protein